MSTKIDIVNEFKTQLVNFLDECIELFPQESDLILARLYISTKSNIISIVEQFNYLINKNESEFKKMIRLRESEFFLKHNIFGELLGNNEKATHFKNIWCSPTMDKENKDVIWEWVNLFVTLSEKYSKNK
jgi:hypothetical protein